MPNILIPMSAFLPNIDPAESTRLNRTRSGNNVVVYKLQKNDRGCGTHEHILMPVEDEHLSMTCRNDEQSRVQQARGTSAQPYPLFVSNKLF